MHNQDTIPYTPIGESLPSLLGEYLVLLPTYEDEPLYYVTPAVYFPDEGQWWTALCDIETGLVRTERGDYSERTVRRARNVTREVVAWAHIPNPANYESVVEDK